MNKTYSRFHIILILFSEFAVCSLQYLVWSVLVFSMQCCIYRAYCVVWSGQCAVSGVKFELPRKHGEKVFPEHFSFALFLLLKIYRNINFFWQNWLVHEFRTAHCEILGSNLQQPHQHHVFRAHFDAEPHSQVEENTKQGIFCPISRSSWQIL